MLHQAILLSLALAAQDPATENPENTSEGRETYFGREVARTMHWSGAGWLMRKTRDDEENSRLLLEKLELKEGQTVCDFGCGNGYYSLPMAERVGPEGRVLAVDLQPEMLKLLGVRLNAAGHENVELVQATLTKPGLAPGTCDAIVLIDVYHEISHPVTVLAALRLALKPKGRLYLLEFRLEDPDVPIKLEHKMSKAQMLLEMKASGLRFAAEFDGLPWQHLMAFERDTEFPRKEGQVEAEGRALAAGLERALSAGDLLTLRGYSPEGRTPAWLKRIEAQVKEMSRKGWMTAMAAAEIQTNTEGPGRVTVRVEAPEVAGEWPLQRSQDGRWFVVDDSSGQ